MKTFLTLLGIVFMASDLVAATPQPAMRSVVERALDRSLEQSMQLYAEMKNHPGRLPQTARDGKLVTCKPHWWTSGFFPGTLWYLYEYSNDPAVRAAAEEMTGRVASEQFTTDNHDVGFQINCSFGNGYRLTGKEAYRQALVNAGNSLATRFSPVVGCIRSWDGRKWRYPVIIDNMMNLELLTVSSALTGDNGHYDMAKSHADKTLTFHYRDDAGSFHVVDYDPETGEMLRQMTHQGAADSSSWSRGQAWGLYGYTMMYRQTGDKRYLDHAVRIGRFIMEHPRLPKDKIPYWDFDAPNIPDADRDASAGAIMASAYIELSTFVGDELGGEFLRLAERQLRSLASPAYLARRGRNADFILMHSTGFLAKNSEVDAPLAYADYYFVEPLMRYKRLLEGKPAVDVFTVLSENPDRALWLSAMRRVADPLLKNMSRGELRKNMPVESNNRDMASRQAVTHLEALGRLIVGIAPWLELGPDDTPEGRLRASYIALAVESIRQGVDPESPDYLNFNEGRQPLVDAAFLAHGLLRARTQLWDRLDPVTRDRLILEMKSSRTIQPGENNWLFFSAMIEVALREFAGEWEYDRIRYALDRHESWYKGDGWYGDGPAFHLDYYNSFVIQPMMMQILDVACRHKMADADQCATARIRYTRYAEQQERMISPEGSYPVLGRSLAYRFGAFHALSDVAYRHMLPPKVSPAQVRCALTTVIRRQIEAPGTFDENGWLRVGFCGHQPAIGESYISTGSLYLCAAGLVALGLPADDPFWSAPAAPWTAQKAWKGVDLQCDKAIKK